MKPYWITAVFTVLVLVGSGLLGPAFSAEKGYYKWLDSSVNPHHSDRPPPPGVDYEFVSTEYGMTRLVTVEESRSNERGSSTASSMPPPAQATRTAAEEQVAVEKIPALCDQARANLDTLESKARVRIRDDDGIRYLSEEEKDVQRQKARDLIAVHCS